MRYYIKAKRGTTDTTVEIVQDSEVRILAKDSAELKTTGTTYTVSGTEMVAYLINCCRNLEQDRTAKSLDDLKTGTCAKLEDIGTKLNELTEIKNTISTEANNTRTNDTTNANNIKSGIDELTEQVEKIAGGMQNPFKAFAIGSTNGTDHHVLVRNIDDIWYTENEGYVMLSNGDKIPVPSTTAMDLYHKIRSLNN